MLLSDERIRAIIVREFITLQRESAKRIEALRGEPPESRNDIISDLATEATAYAGSEAETEYRISESLRDHLRVYGLASVSADSDAFKSLSRGYRAALIEDAQRTLSELSEGVSTERDPLFKGIHSTTPLPDGRGGFTLRELIADFDKGQNAKQVSPKTHRANSPVYVALREHFGEGMPVAKITQKEITAFFDFLDSIPAHALKRYKGKTLKEAAFLESARETPRLLNLL